MKVASFFSGAGGLDLGFEARGFDIVCANDCWKGVKATYEANFNLSLDTRKISKVSPDDIPDADGFIGGPPCQAWSQAGSMRGRDDPRGAAFWDYIRLIKAKQPKFFVAENVKGLLAPRNQEVLVEFYNLLPEYNIKVRLLDCTKYNIPQRRQRVVIIGYHKDTNKRPSEIRESFLAKPDLASIFYRLNQPEPRYQGRASSRFLSRQRVANWTEASYTIVATGRQIPLHPSSPKMVKVSKDKFEIQPGSRRLSVPECAAIQTFPEDFEFHYSNLTDGYKMIGNAVPPRLGAAIAKQIEIDFKI